MIPIKGEIKESAEMPSYTYRLREENVRGYLDGIHAVEQAIYKILMTERYEYVIYSRDYGVELDKVIGKGKAEAKAMIPGIIRDALSTDSRILEVKDFEFYDIDKSSLKTIFNVVTTEGDILREVVVNV